MAVRSQTVRRILSDTSFEVIGVEVIGIEVIGIEVIGIDVIGIKVIGIEVIGIEVMGIKVVHFAARWWIWRKPLGDVIIWSGDLSTSPTT